MQRCWKETEIVNVSFVSKIYKISSIKMKKLIGSTLLKTSFSCYEQRSRIVRNPKSPCQHAAIIRVKCMMGLLNIYGLIENVVW